MADLTKDGIFFERLTVSGKAGEPGYKVDRRVDSQKHGYVHSFYRTRACNWAF